MSQTHPNAPSNSSSSIFQSVFDAALEVYEKTTECELLAHPLAVQLQSCDSPTAILSVLQDLIQQFDRRRRSDKRLANWLKPTVKVLYAFSSTISPAVAHAFSPAKVVFSGIGVLLLAAKDLGANQDVLIDIFLRIENFFQRLESYTEVPPTAAMTEVIVKIMTQMLSLLAIATKEIKQGRSKKFVNNLLGRDDIKDALKSLDTLTMEEARMVNAETLNVTHKVDDKVTELIDDVREVKAVILRSANITDEEKKSQLREKLQNWLSPPDSSKTHNLARKAHHKGTSSWFFQGSIFEQWKTSPSLLWIHGKPGSGKSVLCSGIIDDIMAQRKAGTAIMAYFYCDFRDEFKQSCRNLVLSVISQLCAQSDICCDMLSGIYSAHDNGARTPSDETLTDCLTEMVSLPAQSPIYIIVDALDECPNNSGMPTPREEVLDLVEDLISLRLPNLHLCVTSRYEIDIKAILEPLTSLHVPLHNQSGQNKDIMDYVSSVVHSDRKMRRWREEDRKLVIETLSERAGGMFRWVFCQLAALRHCLPPSLRRTLEELPETLDGTYERVLREINKTNREHARHLLQCLTVALRPLRVEELAEVLAIDFDVSSHGGIPQLNPNWRWEDQHQAVLSTCSSLITIVEDGDSQVVQFSHFSVKEFLTSDRLVCLSENVSCYHILLEPAHTILAQACVGVLFLMDDRVNEDNVGDIPLVKYAAQHWFDHARFENVSSHIRDAMEYFFDAAKQHWTAWCRVQKIEVSWARFSTHKSLYAFPLYFASLGGFYGLAEHLIGKNPEHINSKGGQMMTPLVAALAGKHFQVAELLYQNGAEVDVRDSSGDTPLREACKAGLSDVVQLLLNHGADVNAQGYMRLAPLHTAAIHGHLQIVQLLVEHNADIHIRTALGKTPLHVAAAAGSHHNQNRVRIMQVLLNHGADPNAQDVGGNAPLHLSPWSQSRAGGGLGSVRGTRLLLEHGAKIDAEDKEGRTPLQIALEHGRDDIVKCLKKHGATR